MSDVTDAGAGGDVDDGRGVELYDETREYTAVELCRVCRLPHELLVEYVAHGVVRRGGPDDGPDDGSGGGSGGGRSAEIEPDERFTHVELRRLVRAVRVQSELEVELSNLALVVDLFDRLSEQRRELERLRREIGYGPGR